VPKNKDSNGPNNGGGTLWDGEWIDAQAKSPTLLHPRMPITPQPSQTPWVPRLTLTYHSLCTDARRTLLDSLSLDTKFLNSQGIMDYSLLLGLDIERKVLVSGLVDAVGSFGLWKRLESASKVGLKGKGREGEVTVVRTIYFSLGNGRTIEASY
jgi:1-phosphatidylinositol-3-phosphate 5-kinase